MHGQQPPHAPHSPQGPYSPQPGAPQKKNWWLWGCLGCGGFLFLLFLGVGCMALVGGSGDEPGGSSSGTSSSETTASGSDTDSGDGGSGDDADDSQEEAAAGIGDTVESGAFAFTVTEVETGVQEVGDNPYLSETPQGQYVIVHVTVENIGDEAGTFDSSSQTLLDGEGKEYSTDTSAELALDSDSFLNEINPGNKVEGKLVYDVPAGVEPTEIELRDWLSLDSSAVVSLS
ncbi:DUF4352 domain-containing protein [Salinactinospora qingdaonensis]|uniref:DUF4352 domain-containing protein n=1 Tax=Salinactinospora qingdaonensis TaxID=702744 RepID=A0ABP7G5B8_9ACTN